MKHNLLYIPAVYQLASAPHIKSCKGADTHIITKNSNTKYLTEITSTIHKMNRSHGMKVHGIIVSDPKIVALYVKRLYGTEITSKADVTLDSYQGCVFTHKLKTADGKHSYEIPVVVIPNPEPLKYSARAKFLTARYITKLHDRSWFTAPELNWSLIEDEHSFSEAYLKFSSSSCILTSIDIETKNKEIPADIAALPEINGISTRGMWYFGYARTDSGSKAQRTAYLMPIITCIGYTGIFQDSKGNLSSETIVIPMNSAKRRKWMKLLNATNSPKTMQNGRYDSLYTLRYDAPINNYVYDTYMLMHSTYCELPRALDKIAAFTLRNHMYWKDESGGNLYEYNAKDCHATAWATLVMLKLMPQWAHDNYVSYFKQVFFCITCSLEGFKENEEEATKLRHKYQADIVADQNWWDTVVTQYFNIGSPKQVKTLLTTVLRTGIKDTNKNTLKGIKHKHPLWRLVIDRLLEGRENKKADSTYMNTVTFDGRILYDIDNAGTDTGRYASKASSFWCGTQIQNIPLYAKSKFEFDEGWEGAAIDNAQSESRTTAYVTEDLALIDAVENSKDFHVRNASRFFGIAEEELFAYKESNPKLYKKIRNAIGKRVNHGANYNMGANVLISTMTPEEVILAKHTLKLPSTWTLVQVANYLLKCFDDAYPLIRSRKEGGYHRYIIDCIEATQTLVTPDGWTRFTFHNDPANNKMHLNSLVAHIPQSWSVRIINRACYDAWLQLQIIENKIRVKGQVHDEIVYQARPQNMEYCTNRISELMARPNKYTKKDGTPATMVIPNDPVTGAKVWSDLKD